MIANDNDAPQQASLTELLSALDTAQTSGRTAEAVAMVERIYALLDA